jgi:hypothetical protein
MLATSRKNCKALSVKTLSSPVKSSGACGKPGGKTAFAVFTAENIKSAVNNRVKKFWFNLFIFPFRPHAITNYLSEISLYWITCNIHSHFKAVSSLRRRKTLLNPHFFEKR